MTDRPPLSMSNLGSCDRALVAAIRGMKAIPPSDLVQGWFDRGNAHETDCLAAMRAEGWTVTDEQLEVWVGGFSGHLDGIGGQFDTGPWRVVEIKAPSAWARFEKAYKTDTWSDPLMVKYEWQTSCYMVATGLECVVVCLDDDQLKWFVIETPLHFRSEIEGRVAHIRALAETGLPDACEPGMVEWTCPFRYLHDEKVVTPIDDPAIIGDAREYLRWGTQERLAKAAKEKLRDQLLARLQVGTYQTGDAVTTVYEQAGAGRWDEAALIAKYGPSVRDFKTPGTKTPRLKVTDDAAPTVG